MKHRIWKGFVAGYTGGLIASAAMGPIHTMAAKSEGPGLPEGDDSGDRAVTVQTLDEFVTQSEKAIAEADAVLARQKQNQAPTT